jgi:hypothetical protein
MPVHAIRAEVRVEIELHSYLSLELEGDECLTGSFTRQGQILRYQTGRPQNQSRRFTEDTDSGWESK